MPPGKLPKFSFAHLLRTHVPTKDDVMRSFALRFLGYLALTLWVSLPAYSAPAATTWQVSIARAIAYRQDGNVQLASELLTTVRDAADDPAVRATAAGELGITLLQVHRYDAAQAPLIQAYEAFPAGLTHAHYALQLGTLAAARKQFDEAHRYYAQALASAGDDFDTRMSVNLNLARLAEPVERLARLRSLSQQLTESNPPGSLARHHLNLGYQALRLGKPGLELASRHLEVARRQAATASNTLLQMDALDALAQLYESQARPQESLQLTQQAIGLVRARVSSLHADRLIALEWRQGRLQLAQGRPVAALAAYQRAVEHIEAVRQDIPIETEDGLSSFSQTLEPVYLGYIDLLLQRADKLPEPQRASSLRRAIETVELIRQTELQDFLGDRCAVETVQGGSAGQLSPGTGILYPVILPDRLELLLVTSSGIVRRSSIVNDSTLRATALALANALRQGASDYLPLSQQLYRWLLAPLDQPLNGQHLQKLVIVPAGALRLIPMAALHDGQHYAIEKMAISIVTGMSMTNTTTPMHRTPVSLLAGVALPGPVVEKMMRLTATPEPDSLGTSANSGLARNLQTRAWRSSPETALSRLTADGRQRALEVLRANLALPGVKVEIDALQTVLAGKTLMDAGFTVDQFQQAMRANDYRIVHIASHGVFGDSAESSFIMAYDDVLSLNNLESLLRSEKFQSHPIELLGLSACQTAEGNDRAPLGISGAAIKARARSVLGTLWPIADDAAQSVMKNFYTGITQHGRTKTEALRQAQLELLHQPALSHPFYWAPFVLIGNWL